MRFQSLYCMWCSSHFKAHACSNAFVQFAQKAGNFHRIFLVRKEVLEKENVRSGSLFILKQGVLRADITYGHGRSTELIYPGDVFSWDLLANSEMEAQISAPTESIISEVTSGCIRNFISEKPKNLDAFFAGIDQMIFRQRERLFERTYLPIRARFMKSLYEDFQRRGEIYHGEIIVPKIFTHEDWAGHLGVRRETVSRLTKELEKRFLIRSTESHVYTSQIDELRREATLPTTGNDEE